MIANLHIKSLITYSLVHGNISLLGVRLYGPTEWGTLEIARDDGIWILQRCRYIMRFNSSDHVSHKTMYMYEGKVHPSAKQVTGNTFISINHCKDVYDCTSPSTTVPIR